MGDDKSEVPSSFQMSRKLCDIMVSSMDLGIKLDLDLKAHSHTIRIFNQSFFLCV
jgi:hypothetical protein